jgi:cobalt-zinc-cadmium efflux system membrane fusion protein
MTRWETTAALLCLCASALGGLACGKQNVPRVATRYGVHDSVVTLKEPPSVKFETRQVTTGSALPAPPIPARVTTIEALTSPVFAPLDGRIAETLVRLGDRVKRGERLVEVRSSELPLLNQDVESAAAAARAKEAEVERLVRMVEARVGSEHDLLLARAELERLRIGVKAARERRASLEVIQARGEASYFVVAPRDGTIVQLNALAGQVVGPERALPLATVANIEMVFVVGDVAPRYSQDLYPGQAARIRDEASGSEEIAGQVEFVSEVADPERQTVPVRARVDNTRRLLRPNAYVELTFEPNRTHPRLLVPTPAVVSDGARSVVFVESAKGRFERRAVSLGRQTSELTEIRAGLEPGERVVVTHALLLLNIVQGES